MTTVETKPILTFVTDHDCPAPPEVVYDVIATPSTHLSWAGRESGKHDGIFALEAHDGRADVGSTFTSRGGKDPNGVNEFHDRSVVTEARVAEVFAFSTSSRLDRGRKPEWHARFEHRYELTPAPGGTHVHYTCEVRPQNYRPYWLHPLMRPLTKRLMVKIMMRPHLDNLAKLVAG
jgi:hypothetical protein